MLLLVRGHLLQVVLPGVQASLLARGADPAPEREVRRSQHEGARIRLLDRGGILLAELHDGRVRGASGHDVAVGVPPAEGLVVQLVVGNPTLRGGAEGAHQVRDPLLLQAGGVGNVVGGDVGVGQLRAGGGQAIAAAVAVDGQVGVDGLLRAVDRHREAAAPCCGLVDPGDDRDRDEGVRGCVGLDHQVGRGARHRSGLAVAADEVPVEARIARVDHPVVARGAVAAPAHVGDLDLLCESRIEAVVGDPVDLRTDGLATQRRVHREHWYRGGLRRGRGRAQRQQAQRQALGERQKG